jgi:hypothetical protein
MGATYKFEGPKNRHTDATSQLVGLVAGDVGVGGTVELTEAEYASLSENFVFTPVDGDGQEQAPVSPPVVPDTGARVGDKSDQAKT